MASSRHDGLLDRSRALIATGAGVFVAGAVTSSVAPLLLDTGLWSERRDQLGSSAPITAVPDGAQLRALWLETPEATRLRDATTGMMWGGLGAMAAGLPMMMVGSTRMARAAHLPRGNVTAAWVLYGVGLSFTGAGFATAHPFDLQRSERRYRRERTTTASLVGVGSVFLLTSFALDLLTMARADARVARLSEASTSRERRPRVVPTLSIDGGVTAGLAGAF